ncbi:MAG: histidinol dehydrogenase [Robiginitomaculum sp.]|nr:MAG: histidinol dehydrogenase [Robiginitomaculum sp.]
MQVLLWKGLNTEAQESALSRPNALSQIDVSEILQAVRANGDTALRDYTRRFDGVELGDIRVPVADLKTAWDSLCQEDQAALKTAKANIETFHKAQMPKTISVTTMSGVICSREPRALDSAGLYVPGGTAPLVSTLMMLALPAKIAGVKKCVITTPPQKNGKIATPLLAAAYLCDVDEVYKIGGAQAIAALAYGTQTIPKTVKIFGPGNAYVAAAKAQVSMEMGGPAIDLPAGPSEVMVLADDQANPVFVAADMLAQAEHDTLAQVICVCRSQSFADKIQDELTQQQAQLSRRDITQKALAHARILIVENTDTMIDITNTYAPEHLIVQIENSESILADIQNAGSVFLGQWTPESVGDYASGTNHTLPTFGAARAYSGIVLESFMKYISVQSLTRAGLETLGPVVERLALMEGLDAHKNAVSLRLFNIAGSQS